MSEYGQMGQKPTALPTSTHVQEKKAARRKLLQEVEVRRKIIAVRWYKKMQLKAQSELDTIA